MFYFHTVIALDELRDILDNVERSGTPTSSTSVWQDRMERREEAWEAHRPPIYEQMMSHSYMPRNAVSTVCNPNTRTVIKELVLLSRSCRSANSVQGKQCFVVWTVGLGTCFVHHVIIQFIRAAHAMIEKDGCMAASVHCHQGKQWIVKEH